MEQSPQPVEVALAVSRENDDASIGVQIPNRKGGDVVIRPTVTWKTCALVGDSADNLARIQFPAFLPHRERKCAQRRMEELSDGLQDGLLIDTLVDAYDCMPSGTVRRRPTGRDQVFGGTSVIVMKSIDHSQGRFYQSACTVVVRSTTRDYFRPIPVNTFRCPLCSSTAYEQSLSGALTDPKNFTEQQQVEGIVRHGLPPRMMGFGG